MPNLHIEKMDTMLLKARAQAHLYGDAPGTEPDLHRAAWRRDAAVVRALLDGGAPVEARASWGLTPLCASLLQPLSFEEEVPGCALETWSLLRGTGAGLGQALHLAILCRNEPSVAWLLTQGVDPNQPLPILPFEADGADLCTEHPLGVVWDVYPSARLKLFPEEAMQRDPLMRIALRLVAAGADTDVPLCPAPEEGFRTWLGPVWPHFEAELLRQKVEHPLRPGVARPRM